MNGRRLAAAAILATIVSSVAAEESRALSFGDFFRRPVGPRGLEPTETLLALAGQAVRLSGFVVVDGSTEGPLVLAAMPIVVDDEDEALADDLPPSIAYIHAADPQLAQARRCRGRVEVTGRLELGREPEAGGRHSFVRLAAVDARCIDVPVATSVAPR